MCVIDGTPEWLIYHANLLTGQGCGHARISRMQQFTWKIDGSLNFGTPSPVATAVPVPGGKQ